MGRNESYELIVKRDYDLSNRVWDWSVIQSFTWRGKADVEPVAYGTADTKDEASAEIVRAVTSLLAGSDAD